MGVIQNHIKIIKTRIRSIICMIPKIYLMIKRPMLERGKIDEYLDGLKFQEIIVIGIEHGNEKRIDELTPYKNEKYGGGNGDNYIDFIKNTSKPHIDITYRRLSDSKNTTIFGSSLGGLISF